MSWFVTAPEPLGETRGIRWIASNGLPRLGSARASAEWKWMGTETRRTPSDERLALRPVARPTYASQEIATASVVRIPADIVRAMTAAARNTGRSERELWAEAAREWLNSRAHGDEPPPATPAAALPSVTRSWDEIDSLMAQLRQPATEPAA
ncbi:MAG TPA: hypothetical protein VJN88_04475 [Ktedonobacterales bacterium]|nr:hypothetical protein [Ktedonobacterales bacterium]